MTTDYAALALQIKRWAQELGFAQLGITGVSLPDAERQLQKWLDAGYHGEMDYMASHGMLRARPAELVPGTLRVLSVRMDYLPKGAGFATATNKVTFIDKNFDIEAMPLKSKEAVATDIINKVISHYEKNS